MRRVAAATGRPAAVRGHLTQARDVCCDPSEELSAVIAGRDSRLEAVGSGIGRDGQGIIVQNVEELAVTEPKAILDPTLLRVWNECEPAPRHHQESTAAPQTMQMKHSDRSQ